MRRLLLAPLIVLFASAALPLGTHATPEHAPTGATLYQANFKTKGLKGWIIRGDGWHVNRKGVVSFDGYLGDIRAPFRSGKVRYFAVQAKIKALGPVEKGAQGAYGLVVRDTGQQSSGIEGGFSPDLFGSEVGDTGPGVLAWSNDNVGGIHPALHSGYNTYRLEVRDTDYSLFINGQKIVAFKIADYRAGTRVGISSGLEKLQLISFKVTRLQPAAPLPTLPPVKAIDLGPADVPSPLTLALGSYYTPEEIAYLMTIYPVIDLEGCIIEHAVDFGPSGPLPSAGPVFLNSSVAAFSSAQAAQLSLASYWKDVQKGSSSNTKYAAGSLSGVGEEAHQLSYDYSDTADKFTLVAVVFWRGPYAVTVEDRFIQGTVSHDDMINQVAALAKLMDMRIEKAGSSAWKS